MNSLSRVNFYDLSRAELGALLKERFGLPEFRAKQLFEWVYRHKVTDFERMTTISSELRAELAAQLEFSQLKIQNRAISSDGTRKYLFELDDGKLVESVMIKQPRRMTLCVSSQVGCAMGCTFCRTATMNLHRSLRASEIIGQVLGVIEDAKNFDDMFTNIVFMGMGEPMHNLENLLSAVSILKDRHGLAIAPRKITVSSVGLVPKIKRFLEEEKDVNLAISLNATTDEVRSRIMPINKRFPISTLLETLRGSPRTKRKRYTIEYVLLRDVNDSIEDMRRLPKLLHGLPAKVNLIPYNENAGLGYFAPRLERINAFRDTLERQGINATIRWSKGVDISAACGQLASEAKKTSARAPQKSTSPALLTIAS